MGARAFLALAESFFHVRGLVLDIDEDSFQACLGRALVPTLLPGDIVVVDNLSSHRRPGMRRATCTAEGLRRRIGGLFRRHPASECAICVRNAGWGLT